MVVALGRLGNTQITMLVNIVKEVKKGSSSLLVGSI